MRRRSPASPRSRGPVAAAAPPWTWRPSPPSSTSSAAARSRPSPTPDDPAAARRGRGSVPWPQGRAAHAPGRHRPAPGRGPAPGRRGWQTPSARSWSASSRARRERLDRDRPGRPARARANRRHAARPALPRGSLHPLIETQREIARIFRQFGFVVYECPEVETDELNFQLLNIPEDHPARDLWDTIYVIAGRRTDAALPAAHPHVARPDPADARIAAADPRHPARSLLPLRGGRRQPWLRVLPGRGPDDRRGHDHGHPARRYSTNSPTRMFGADRGPAFGRATTRSRSHRSHSTSAARSAAASAVRRASARAG